MLEMLHNTTINLLKAEMILGGQMHMLQPISALISLSHRYFTLFFYLLGSCHVYYIKNKMLQLLDITATSNLAWLIAAAEK